MIKNYFILFIFVLALLVGCGPSFQIIETTDKFSDTSKPYGYLGQGNRLSTKSSQGGMHIDDSGVYINPFADLDRNTNAVVSTGFSIQHYNFPNGAFSPILRIIFLTHDSQRIELDMMNQNSTYNLGGWNNITHEYNSSMNEGGIAFLPKEDFYKICNAQWLEVKIIGGKREQTYNKDEISSSFLENLKKFKEHIENPNSTK